MPRREIRDHRNAPGRGLESVIAMDPDDKALLARAFADAELVRPPLWQRVIASLRPTPRGESNYADTRSLRQRVAAASKAGREQSRR